MSLAAVLVAVVTMDSSSPFVPDVGVFVVVVVGVVGVVVGCFFSSPADASTAPSVVGIGPDPPRAFDFLVSFGDVGDSGCLSPNSDSPSVFTVIFTFWIR